MVFTHPHPPENGVINLRMRRETYMRVYKPLCVMGGKAREGGGGQSARGSPFALSSLRGILPK